MRYHFAEIEIGGGNDCQAEKLPEKKKEKQIPYSYNIQDEVLIPQTLDPKREKFTQMRRIAQQSRFNGSDDPNALFYRRGQRQDMARVFYHQAVFMADFDDGFTHQVPLTLYYPSYHHLSYEQLRTYFSWRRSVRDGNITHISTSYVFIFVYEILNQVGITQPIDGPDILLALWRAFREKEAPLDKYLVRWIKDYFVYYKLPLRFGDFLKSNPDLAEKYPDDYSGDNTDDFTQLYRGLSSYDIGKSSFYNIPQYKALMEDAFLFVISQIKGILQASDVALDDLLYSKSLKKKKHWHPFDGSLFYERPGCPDRRAELSAQEIYSCKGGAWTRRQLSDCDRALVGYLMKETESALRTAVKYKYRLASGTVPAAAGRVFQSLGIQLDRVIAGAVQAFYQEVSKTVVAVDPAALAKIRREAQIIQERLTVDTEENMPEPITALPQTDLPIAVKPKLPPDMTPTAFSPWDAFFAALTPAEISALTVILRGGRFNACAAENNLMPEVLADGINQKAYESIRDNILEYGEQPVIYGDYIEEITKRVKTDE